MAAIVGDKMPHCNTTLVKRYNSPINSPTTMSGIQWIVDQIGVMPARKPAKRRTDPIRAGGTPALLLQWISRQPGRYFALCELIDGTGCSRAALTWAVIHLGALGYIDAAPCDPRNPRYLRYCFSRVDTSEIDGILDKEPG